MPPRSQTADLRWTTDDNVPVDLYYFLLASNPQTPVTFTGKSSITTATVTATSVTGQTGDIADFNTPGGNGLHIFNNGETTIGVDASATQTLFIGGGSGTAQVFTVGAGNTEPLIVGLNSGGLPVYQVNNDGSVRLNIQSTGSNLRSGTGVPSNSLGSNGDYYFQSNAEKIYAKGGGTWTQISPGGAALVVQGVQSADHANQTIPVTFTDIGFGLSITVAASGTSRIAFVNAQLTYRSVPDALLAVALDGTIKLQTAGGTRDANLNITDYANGPITIPGDNATHTITMQWAAVSGTGPVDITGSGTTLQVIS